MNNPQWLELPMSRTIFYGPKDVRAIEVRLYFLVYCIAVYEWNLITEVSVFHSIVCSFFQSQPF